MITEESLKGGQPEALAALLAFMSSPSQFFILGGPAGTGKTSLVRVFKDKVKGRVLFTAPTNKAVRVLRKSLEVEDYFPECKTIYSALGLKLDTNGELKELATPEKEPDLSRYALIVIDEGSMLPPQLLKFLTASLSPKVKVLVLGDPYQLPPVGHTISPIWRMPEEGDADTFQLTKILRHDNQILNLVTAIRGQIDKPFPSIRIASAFDEVGGVFKMADRDFLARLSALAADGAFSTPEDHKLIAWRNLTVQAMNNHIRQAIFPGAKSIWEVGDRVILTEPAKDFANNLFASTDDEGIVRRVAEHMHPIHEQFKCFVLDVILDTNKAVTLWVLHPNYQQAWDSYVKDLAAEARRNPRLWKTYWEFQEKFHKVRYGYAITAHRSQGSTYKTAFVCSQDILSNLTRKEAFQCLYVATSRPSQRLIIS